MGRVNWTAGGNARRFFMSDRAPTVNASPNEAEVLRAKGLLERKQFAEALAVIRQLLITSPENRDALYIEAVSLRYLGRLAEALEALTRLEHAHPDYGRLFQERGHCHRERGETEAAIEAYRRAVMLNASLPASWRALAVLEKSAGRALEASKAAAIAAELARQPPEVVVANSFFSEGDIARAESLIRDFLLKHPTDLEGMRLLGRIGLKFEVYDDAELLLGTVLERAPDYHAARYDYAQALAYRQKHLEALREAEKLLAIEPENILFQMLKGNALVGLGRHEEALEVFYGLRPVSKDNPTLHLAIAHTEKTIGRTSDAVASYHRAAEARPDFGDAYWSLANLKTYRFSDLELDRMRAQEARPEIGREDRYHLCFALGKALEDRGDYETAFRYYERGNALKQREVVYDAAALEANFKRQQELCTVEFFKARRGWGDATAAPIFIVGLPRAGSTLLEQILASHSAVEGTKELADIPRLVQQLNGRETTTGTSRYPTILADLGEDDVRRFGARFLEDTQIFRSGKPHFIDKMPNNFRHIGLIHLMLPNAKIIDARREPMACCFSNFKQLFATGQEFTYGLEAIGRYYRAYVELMAHWDRVLPGRVLRVQHESVIDDLEGNVRRILDYCELPFEPACLEYYKTERSVRTPSSEQVRRPIFRDSLDQWTHFDPWLAPLKKALGDLVESH
jgi:tetratricopeptide (TPR) repeat protein